MALEAWLSFTSTEGQTTHTIKVLECEFEFHQDLDKTGKPCSRPQGGTIDIVIESTDKITITEWMFAPMSLKDGKIQFPLRFGKRKTLEFEEAVCVKYREIFHASDSMPMLVYFTISANRIKIGEALFENDWKNLPK